MDKKGHTGQKSIEDTVDSNPGGEPYQEATHKTNATDENSDGPPVVPSVSPLISFAYSSNSLTISIAVYDDATGQQRRPPGYVHNH